MKEKAIKFKKYLSLNRILGRFRLRSKLILSYVILIILLISFLGISYYKTTSDQMSKLAAKNIYELIRKNNESIDTKLSKVIDASLSLISDQHLFTILSDIKQSDEKSIVSADKEISRILTQYFMTTPEIYSYKLVTSYYTFTPDTGGTQPGFLPFREFSHTSLYKEARKAQGSVVWMPTYDFVEEFNQLDLENTKMEGRYVFSAVRVIDSLKFDNGQVIHLNDEIERPILVLDFLPSFFTELYEKSNIMKDSFYSVITREGTVVAMSQESEDIIDELIPWVKGIGSSSSGFNYVTINGEKRILCYDISKVTNWVTAVVINPNDLTRPLVEEMREKTIKIALILCLASMLIAYVISIRVTIPINRLTKAARKIGGGNFDIILHEEGDVEFKQLIKTINDMCSEIKKLIKENYEVKLREKEATIGALTLQLNPHFLYNTINIINWMAIRNKQKDISRMLMSLSYMLDYTVRSKSDFVYFREDLEWLKRYLYIMSIRFEDKFVVEYNIDQQTLEQRVPKLFLQPIIENVFTHAFEDTTRDGLIRVSAEIRDDKMIFMVEDNGKGINPEEIDGILNCTKKDDFSIGVSNVNKRFKILYGEEYGINISPGEERGTLVTITLPIKDNQHPINLH